MAVVGSMRAVVLLDVVNLLSEFLLSSAAAFCELFHQVIALAAGATAAATVGMHALSFLDTSAAGANDDENCDFTLHAAGATAAATVGMHTLSFLTKSAAGAIADVFLVLIVLHGQPPLPLCTLCSSWTNLQLERQRRSSWSLLCKRQLDGQPPLSLRVWCPSLYSPVLALVSGFSCGCLLRFSVCGRNKETSNSIVKMKSLPNFRLSSRRLRFLQFLSGAHVRVLLDFCWNAFTWSLEIHWIELVDYWHGEDTKKRRIERFS